jgi:hypothetical protein
MILNFNFCNPLDIILFMEELQINLFILYSFLKYDVFSYYNKDIILQILEGNGNILNSLEQSKFGKWDNEKKIFYLNLKYFESYDNIDHISIINIDFGELYYNMQLILQDEITEFNYTIINNITDNLENIKLLYVSLDNFYGYKNQIKKNIL